MTRLRRKHAVVLFAAVVALGTLWYLLRFTPIVSDQVGRAFTSNLLQERGYRLVLGRVRGNPLGKIAVDEVRLLRDRPGASEVARLRGLELRLDFWQLLRGRVKVHRLRLLEPVVQLGAEDLHWQRRKDLPSGPPPPPLHLAGVEIVGGRVEFPLDSLRTLCLVDLETEVALEVEGGSSRLQVERFSAGLPLQSLVVLQGAGNLTYGSEGLQVEAARLQTSRSQVTGVATYRGSPRTLHLNGEATTFDLADLDSLVQLPVGGTLTGPFELQWSPQAIAFTGTWSGEYAAHALDSVQVDLRWTPAKFTLRRAEGRLQTSRFALSLEAEHEALHGRARLRDFDLRAWRSDLPVSRLEAQLEFSRRSPGDSLQLRAALGPSDLAGVAITKGHGRAAILGRSASCREIQLETARGVLHGEGTLQGQAVSFSWELEADDVAGFAKPLGLGSLHAAADLQGQIEGTLDSLGCIAAGDFATLRYGSLAAERGVIDLQASRLFPVPAVEMDVRAEGLALGGRKLGRLTSLMSYDGEALHLERAEVAAVDTSVTVAASFRTLARDWNGDPRPAQLLSLHTALIQIGGQEFRVEEPASLWWSGRATRVDSLRLLSRSGGARIDGVLDLGANRVDARTEVRDFDLGFLSQLAGAQQPLAGTGTGWLEVHGRLDATQVDSRLAVRAGRWQALEVDSVRVDLQSDAFGSSLRSVSAYTPFGGIRVNGRIAYLPSLSRWLRGASGPGEPEAFSKAALELHVEVDDLALEPFWRGLRGLQAPAPWEARLTTKLDVEGSLGDPRLGASGAARALHLRRGIEVDSLRFEAQYAGGSLRVPHLKAHAAGASVDVEGQLPLTLHLLRGIKLRREEPVDADLVLLSSSFAVVPRFISFFEPAPQGVPPGTVEATLHLGGTLAKPKLNGKLQVAGAGFTLANLEEVYYDVNATGNFVDDTLELGEIHGRTGPNGWVRGSGWVRFAGLAVSDYALAFDADHVPVYSIPDIAAIVGGHIDIHAVHLFETAAPIPEFKGSLQVRDAEITREFTEGRGEGSLLEPTDRPEWLADVAIEAPGRVWVHNSNADAELAGNVQMLRTTAGLDVTGRATVKRGHYSAYLEKFEITRGELDFSRNPGWEPDLDLEARRGRVNERIYVQLTGTPSQPQLVFTSDNRETSAELQQILMADIRNDPSNVATTVVENVFTDLGYLDSISIDPASSRQPVAEGQQAPLISAYNVSAGWAVSDRVFVTYTRGLNQSDLNQRVAVEFDVLRGLLLASSWEIRYIPSPELLSDAAQNAFNVDVKFRHEY